METTNLTQTKTCTRCLQEVSLENFSVFNRAGSLKSVTESRCKKCMAELRVLKKRTKEGLILNIYSEQKESSKTREHTPPAYSIKELIEWVYLQPNFNLLYDNWVNAEYDKWLRPSIDRLDNAIPYNLSNIQLMTWKENNTKSHTDKLTGVHSVDSKPIYKYTLLGEYICEYYSISEAARQHNFSNSLITTAIKNAGTAGGFQWSYTKQPKLSMYRPAYATKGSITQLTLAGEFIREWESGAAIAKFYNMVNASSIHAVCKGSRNSAKGFKWQYSSI